MNIHRLVNITILNEQNHSSLHIFKSLVSFFIVPVHPSLTKLISTLVSGKFLFTVSHKTVVISLVMMRGGLEDVFFH